ncbi:MAG: hypothetical protein ACE5LU_07985 [Anaerolineae bacterium]
MMDSSVFVARARELGLLSGFPDSALAGHGQVCFVTGEASSRGSARRAGAGKTCPELRLRAAPVTELAFTRRRPNVHTDNQ